MTTSDSYRIGVDALQFFGAEPSEQLRSYRRLNAVSQPNFFPQKRDEDLGCDYFFGVACVFKTFAGSLSDKFLSAEDADHLEDFNHRLNVFMQDGTAAEWSEAGVVEGIVWQALPDNARQALDQLGEPVAREAAIFDIDALIDPDEFRTTAAAKTLLATRTSSD